MSEPKRDTARELGKIAHTELASTDPAATKKFLESAFNWDFEVVKTPQGEIFTFNATRGARGSIRKTGSGEQPSNVNYILVEDLAAAESAIEKAGGDVVLPRVEVPGMGSFFWFKVPGGPVLACWQDAPG